jgi:hypothetical protein
MSNHVTAASIGQGGIGAAPRLRPLGTVVAGGHQAAASVETVMTPDEILACYPWSIGVCFRCGNRDLFVTPMDEVVTPRGDRYELAACGSCILQLEEERRRFAERRGFPYQPGTLGRP